MDVPPLLAASVSKAPSRTFVIFTLAKASFGVSGAATAIPASTTTGGWASVNVTTPPVGVSVGASFTGTTARDLPTTLLLAGPSLTLKLITRGMGLGLWELFR